MERTAFEDRQSICDLISRLCLYRDTQVVDAWVDLFTEDAELHARRLVVGSDALRAYFLDALAGMHHLQANHAVEVDGDDATCVASLLVTSGRSIHLTGRTHDELRRTAAGWKIARRRYIVDRN